MMSSYMINCNAFVDKLELKSTKDEQANICVNPLNLKGNDQWVVSTHQPIPVLFSLKAGS